MTATAYSHAFRIALHDTDAAGVLFFAHLFRHAHDAYEGLMAEIGWPLEAMIRDGGLALPLVHAQADYRRPMRHGTAVRVAVRIAAIGTTSFTLDYGFTDREGDLLATARSVHAAISPNGSGSVQLPPDLAAALRDRSGDAQ